MDLWSHLAVNLDILPQLLINALIAGSIYALATAGLSLTYGVLRILNFAHGHLMMLGAYFYYMYSIQCGFGVASSLALSICSAIVIGAFSMRVFVAPFLSYSVLLPFVTTLALSTILESSVSMIFGVNVKSLSAGMSVSSYDLGYFSITPTQIVIIVGAIVILGLLAVIVHHTPLGRRLRALSEFGAAAESLGVDRTRYIYGVFCLGVVLATFAGIMAGFETNIQPTMGSSYSIKAFAAMILGGLGNLWGTIAGSFLLGLVENLSIGLDLGGYSLPAGYKDAFSFFVILLVLLIKPEGIFSRRRRRV